MKLASLRSGRDGKLLVVSRDLSSAVAVPDIAATMQNALDNWATVEPSLNTIYQQLNNGSIGSAIRLDTAQLAAPLPRAYQWLDGSAYVNHVELVRRARGVEMPESFWREPLMYQGGSDGFLGPRETIPCGDVEWGLDFEGEIAVMTDDVPMSTSAEEAGQHIKLLALVNDISLRGLIPGELAKGFGFLQSKPSSAFSPVAVTPDELGDCWQDTRVHLPLLSFLNNAAFGKPDAGVDMTFNFAQLIAHAAMTRNLCSGSVIGSGTVSNRQPVNAAAAVENGGLGYSCIVERRTIETIESGEPVTAFLQPGDQLRIEMLDPRGQSVFGAIEQTVSSR